MKAFFTCEQKLGNTIFTFSQKARRAFQVLCKQKKLI